MQKIKCIIIEDEPLAVKVLKDFIEQVPQLELKEIFREAISAGIYLQAENIDLIFLDIHLPKLKGLSFLRTLQHPPAIIVTTAYHQYALEGYELNVVDYLMKPIPFARFITAVNKASRFISLPIGPVSIPDKQENAIFLTINRRKVKIALDDILYVESKKEYVQINTTQHQFISKMGTSDLESLLPLDRFRRIHRSFIVAIEKIDTYNKENVEIRGRKIPIGKHYKKETEEVFKGI